MKGCQWNDSLSKKKRRSRLVRRENILIFLTTTTVGQCLRLYQKFHFKITFIRSIFQSFETTLKKLQFRYNGKLTLQFATRGYCTTGKHWHCIIIKNKTMPLCSKQSSLFSIYAVSSCGKLKGSCWSTSYHFTSRVTVQIIFVFLFIILFSSSSSSSSVSSSSIESFGWGNQWLMP